jgi:hypothetical protein
MLQNRHSEAKASTAVLHMHMIWECNAICEVLRLVNESTAILCSNMASARSYEQLSVFGIAGCLALVHSPKLGETPTLLGPLERASPNHRTTYVGRVNCCWFSRTQSCLVPRPVKLTALTLGVRTTYVKFKLYCD